MPVVSWADRMNSAEEGAKEFELLPPNVYSFVIKDAAKVGETSKGNPKFTINPSVESGERANARVFHDFSVSESAYAMKNFFFGDLAILGLGTEFFNSNPSDQQIAQALQGRRFTAEVFHEDGSNGKTYARLRNFGNPVGPAPAAGVPGGIAAGGGQPSGMPQAAPLGQQSAQAGPPAAAQQQASVNPWETPGHPAAQAPGIQLPPSFS